MNIVVECKSLPEHAAEYCPYYYGAGDITVSACFAHPVNNQIYRLPECSITLLDILMFSKNMVPDEEYDCVLEVSSFKTADLYTNHRNSVRGRFWNCVPDRYMPKYNPYKNQQCIEIDGDIILIAPYNNLLSGKAEDGGLIEIIPQAPFNLRSVRTASDNLGCMFIKKA